MWKKHVTRWLHILMCPDHPEIFLLHSAVKTGMLVIVTASQPLLGQNVPPAYDWGIGGYYKNRRCRIWH
ncbi:hypothetical protein SAMN04488054_104210 [Salibacterium qingdaonense]|uniref:Uncharacterized protein n=1 Tax=Salibacterium qingdaonense TaxID=266892 RepID=A0A1I4KAK2_9BACI|nr:hypothetical protein SAMN04488054_104210 [Salibacterium qingdaonense]